MRETNKVQTANPFRRGDFVRNKDTGEIFSVYSVLKGTITMISTTKPERIVTDGFWHYEPAGNGE